MPSTIGRTHHCPGKTGAVGKIPQGGCRVNKSTGHCKTHEILCKIHPNIYFFKKENAKCWKCIGRDRALSREKNEKAARQKDQNEKAMADSKENKKIRTKPRHNKDGTGRDTGSGDLSKGAC